MSERGAVPSVLGFEVFGAAVGLAVITGALAVVAPSLSALTGVLAALAIAGWVTQQRREGQGGMNPRRHRRWAALGVLALGAVVYFAPPVGGEPLRGLVLGAALVPLWVVERWRTHWPARSGATA
jgi:hypothetical protein